MKVYVRYLNVIIRPMKSALGKVPYPLLRCLYDNWERARVTVDLYVGEVMHRRSRPKAYEFVYVDNIVVDIDKLRDDAVGQRLFSWQF